MKIRDVLDGFEVVRRDDPGPDETPTQGVVGPNTVRVSMAVHYHAACHCFTRLLEAPF